MKMHQYSIRVSYISCQSIHRPPARHKFTYADNVAAMVSRFTVRALNVAAGPAGGEPKTETHCPHTARDHTVLLYSVIGPGLSSRIKHATMPALVQESAYYIRKGSFSSWSCPSRCKSPKGILCIPSKAFAESDLVCISGVHRENTVNSEFEFLRPSQSHSCFHIQLSRSDTFVKHGS